MKIESTVILEEIAKMKQISSKNQDYVTGYMSALSELEGFINQKEYAEKQHRCGNCKWLIGVNNSSFKDCVNPNKYFRTRSAHLRYPCTKACKLFEKK